MKGKILLSAITGLLFFLVAYLALRILNIGYAISLALGAGLLFGSLLLPALILYEKIMDRQYAKYEARFSAPVFYKENGAFDLGNGLTRHGKVYFCDHGIVCISLEQKPSLSEEILLEDIESCQNTAAQLRVFTKDKRIYVIVLPSATELAAQLKDRGWPFED